MIHAFTVDVEDYHNIIARDWLGRDGPPTRAVVENTGRFLRHLATRNRRATFFVLGEVAAAYPGLIRDIAAGGHELGVHGFYHRQVFKLTAESFRKEVVDAKKLIEDISGQPVRGIALRRFPSCRIRRGRWMFWRRRDSCTTPVFSRLRGDAMAGRGFERIFTR